VVGPGMARNSRPARTVIAVGPCVVKTVWRVDDLRFYALQAPRKSTENAGLKWSFVLSMVLSENRFTLCPNAALRVRTMLYRFVSRQPAASASSTEQNQRVPLLIFILIWVYQRLFGWW